jgi:hypothetical protein
VQIFLKKSNLLLKVHELNLHFFVWRNVTSFSFHKISILADFLSTCIKTLFSSNLDAIILGWEPVD